jgi:hypothetical protein
MSLEASGKVEHFIQSLKLPIEVASVLLESEKDCHQFFEGFYMRNKYVIDDLLDYREYKIEKSQKTLDLFVEECYNSNMRQAFQSTFYQSFSEGDMNMIGQAILAGKTSLAQLFIGFQKNPNKNILKNIL